MDIDRLAYFLTITTLVGGFAINRDPLEGHSGRAEIVDLEALDDGTAVVTLRGDAGSFLVRLRSNGSTMWAKRMPGTVGGHSLGSTNGKIAVWIREDQNLALVTYSIDGNHLWTHPLANESDDALPVGARTVFAGDTAVAWSYYDGAEHIIGLSADTGSVQWDHTTSIDGVSSVTASGEVLIRQVHRDLGVDPRSGRIIYERKTTEEFPLENHCLRGGYSWGYTTGVVALDHLGIRATRLPPRPALDASR